jgi:hypothetical protein
MAHKVSRQDEEDTEKFQSVLEDFALNKHPTLQPQNHHHPLVYQKLNLPSLLQLEVVPLFFSSRKIFCKTKTKKKEKKKRGNVLKSKMFIHLSG